MFIVKCVDPNCLLLAHSHIIIIVVITGENGTVIFFKRGNGAAAQTDRKRFALL